MARTYLVTYSELKEIKPTLHMILLVAMNVEKIEKQKIGEG